MMKYLKYLLLCAGLLAVLTGCEKTPEENSSAGMTLDTSNILETDAEAEASTDTEQETGFTEHSAQTSDQPSETEEISDSDISDISDTSGVTETDPASQTSTTEIHTTEHITTDTVTSDNNPEQNPDPETPDPVTWIVSPDTPDAPNTPNTPDAPPEVTQASVPDVTEPEITEPIAEDPDALKITYQGQVITIGGDVKKFTESVKPNFEQSAPSCMGDGEDIVYYYDDLTIYVWSNAGSMLATGVDVTSPGIAPVQGYDIGSAADFTNEKVIDCGNGSTIILAEAGGQVISISYNKDF
ncbi:MAG: hypothetical protein K2O42_07895 [Oscillospiraceae bacterium]|nr:hypothetical protein [Oscillospiraceae bacterium]